MINYQRLLSPILEFFHIGKIHNARVWIIVTTGHCSAPTAAPSTNMTLHEQGLFYAGDWILLQLLEAWKHGLWTSPPWWRPDHHCRTSWPGSCSLYHRQDGEKSGSCHLNWRVQECPTILHTRKPPPHKPLNLHKVGDWTQEHSRRTPGLHRCTC